MFSLPRGSLVLGRHLADEKTSMSFIIHYSLLQTGKGKKE
jgi:hypothetical protein